VFCGPWDKLGHVGNVIFPCVMTISPLLRLLLSDEWAMAVSSFIMASGHTLVIIGYWTCSCGCVCVCVHALFCVAIVCSYKMKMRDHCS
jgi:hypothetical protein